MDISYHYVQVKRLLTIGLLPLALGLAALGMLFSSWLYTYHRLTDEALIAELSFDRLGEQVYRASVSTGDLCRVELYQLHGDQWRIEAQFIKWKYWANLLGLDAMYRLDRIEGRYRDVAQQNERRTVAYALPRSTAVDMVDVADALGRLNFLLDASYGSSTYHHIDTATVYRVYRTQTGLITRTAPRRQAVSNGQILSIEIDRACGEESGAWATAARWLDDRLVGWRR